MRNQSLFNQSVSEFPDDHSFNGIDVVKLIGAFLVLMIHIMPFPKGFPAGADISLNFWIKNCLCRIAVPFYFTAAGFFLFRKIDFSQFDTKRTRDYCLRILRMLGVWVFLLFCGSIVPLWYLCALVLAVLILSFLIKRKVPFGIIVLISIVLYLIGLFGDSYYGFLEPLKSYPVPGFLINSYDIVFGTTRNGFFFGMAFVSMGAIFAKKRIVMNRAVAWIGFILSEVGLFFEIYLLRTYSEPKDYNMFFFLLPAVFFLFYIASHVNLRNKPVYASLRSVGVLIYFGHVFVNFFVRNTILLIDQSQPDAPYPVRFLSVVVITTFLAILIERLSRKERFSWMKYLYS